LSILWFQQGDSNDAVPVSGAILFAPRNEERVKKLSAKQNSMVLVTEKGGLGWPGKVR
jgi:hypothetical protein